MASEITVLAALSFRKGGVISGIDPGPITVTMTGTKSLRGVQSIGFAAEEAIVIGEVPAGGYIIIRNLDATNYVRIRPLAGTTPLIRLTPARPVCVFPLDASATAPTAQADTAAVLIEYLVLEA